MSSFNPTPAEVALTSNVFNIADPQRLGIVTGDSAVKVLMGANLSHAVLGEIWAISDKENNGFLTRKGVAIALRLIGHAQKGEPVTDDLVNKPGPLAHIDGVSELLAVGSPTRAVSNSSPSRQGTSFPPLTSQDKAKFLKLFIGCGPVNGLLSGDKARDVFIKSKLPYEKLSQIWVLADTKVRGSLDSTDFIIGMYLIQASMSLSGFTLPATLPSWIIEQASQNDINTTLTSHATGGSATGFGSPMQGSFQIPSQHTGSRPAAFLSGVIKPNYTGQGQATSHFPRQSPSTFSNLSPDSSSANAPFRGSQTQMQPWDVSVVAKATSDKFFDNLDTQRRGYIEGDVAVPFMLDSKLAEDDLARIWDLADLHKDGRLTRDGFAVAMHLINSKLSGTEIPASLPPSLVPPAVRLSQPSVTMGAASEIHRDLLGDDTPPGTAVPPQPTGGSLPGPPIASAPVPNHTMGQGALQNAFPSGRKTSAFLPAISKDLLGDDDDESSKTGAVPDNSAEVGNLQNQIASTTRSQSATQAERIAVEQTVTEQASQLTRLQTQLSAAKASYETESRLLATLRERLATQRAEIQKTQEELIRAESDLSATRVEKAEVEGSVLRDKEEIRELQRKMKDMADETSGLKSNVEKLRKDARQQKGLLAIAKKQLATAEAEKIKVSKELEAAQNELDVVQQENEHVDAHIARLEATNSPSAPTSEVAQTDRVASPAPSALAAGIPLPETPHPATPQHQISKQTTNPFERLAMASASASVTTNTNVQTLFHSSETVPEDKAASSDPDPFVLSAPSLGLSVDHSAAPVQSSSGLEQSVVTPQLDASPLETTGPSPPATTLSPSDNDALFLTPASSGSPMDPGIEGHTSQVGQSGPDAFPPESHDDAVLKPLQEVENDGSDTSDSDDEPLGSKVFAQKAAESVGTDVIVPPTVTHDAAPDLGPHSPHPAFEDSFGVPVGLTVPSVPKKLSPPTSGKSSPRRSMSPGGALSTRTLSSHSIPGGMDPFGASAFSQTPLEPPDGETAPPPTIETVLEPNTAPANTSSVSDFDEAFGKIPTTAKDSAPAFKFDSVFDDNFDFSSANGNMDTPVHLTDENGSEPPVSHTRTPFGIFSPVTASTTEPPELPQVPKPISGSGAASVGQVFVPQTSIVSTPNGDSGHATSFDDAFGISTAEQPHINGQAHTSTGNGLPFNNATAVDVAFQEPPTAGPPGITIPSKAQPSPPARETSPVIRPVSPQQSRVSSSAPRSSSPPQRASSPRGRALSGSKSESKPEGSSKHKLSIRFPFGRKDKTKDKEEKRSQAQVQHQLLEQQQFLSPVTEPRLPGTVTPAVEDDAEPVKQLSAMGFSRTQSIAALETHGYDVQKALNSLLGTT